MKVAAYCRVSTGYGEQMDSFDNQVDVYMDKIRKTPGWDLADIYADHEVSGTTDKRPEFQRMLQDAERGKFQLLVVKSISRFARNTIISLETVRHLKSLGIGIVFEKEQIDTTQPFSEMMLTFYAAFAQEESRNTSERVKRGIKMHQARGEVNWCPLYGYERVNDVPFTIVEHEAAVVRRIFESYVNGLTTHEIRNQLNEEGIPSPSGSLWGDSALASLLQNERYTGLVLTSKFFTDNHLNHKMKKNRGEVEQIRITEHHTPIISEALFADAQFVRQMRRENTYPYGNFLVCPFCGERLVRQQSGWGCKCERFYIPKDKLKKTVIRAYAELDTEGIEDGMVRELKDAYPEMGTVEYWWLKDLVDHIGFSLDGKTMKVHWKCGKQTEVPTDYNRMRADIRSRTVREARREQAAKPRKKEVNTILRVRRVLAAT